MSIKKELLQLVVAENSLVAKHTHLLKLRAFQSEEFPEMKPGQFVEVQAPGGHVLLRRPISVCNVEDSELWLLVARVGRGTIAIADAQVGSQLSVLLPLGNTFSIDGVQRPLLVGGGVGIAPMLYLAKKLSMQGIRPDILLGGRTADQLGLLDKFRCYGELYITTEDGSLGHKGRVTEHPLWTNATYDRIYTCGPKPMMVALHHLTANYGIDCEVSLENTMACGIGACLCCVEDTQNGGNVCVCTEGPVFNSKQLKW